MKASWTVLFIVVLAVGWTLADARQAPLTGEPARVAFVSGQRVLNESPAARAEVARFQAMQKKKAAELRALQEALASTRLKLTQATTAAARAELQQQEKKQRADLEQATAQAKTDVQAQQREMMAELQTQIKPVMEEIAKSQGIDLVLNAEAALMWGSAHLDLTAAVLERMKAKAAEGGPEKKP
jgi:outer membrane protein